MRVRYKIKKLIKFTTITHHNMPDLDYSSTIDTPYSVLECVFGVPVNIQGVFMWSIKFDDENYAMISKTIYTDDNINEIAQWNITAYNKHSMKLVKQTISQRTKLHYIQELTISAVPIWLELYRGKTRLYENQPVESTFSGITTYISKYGEGHVGLNNTPTDLKHGVEEYVLIKKSKLDDLIKFVDTQNK